MRRAKAWRGEKRFSRVVGVTYLYFEGMTSVSARVCCVQISSLNYSSRDKKDRHIGCAYKHIKNLFVPNESMADVLIEGTCWLSDAYFSPVWFERLKKNKKHRGRSLFYRSSLTWQIHASTQTSQLVCFSQPALERLTCFSQEFISDNLCLLAYYLSPLNSNIIWNKFVSNHKEKIRKKNNRKKHEKYIRQKIKW